MSKEKIKYQVTKQECQKRIDELNHVCDYCGRKIKPLRTVDNSGNPTYWEGCMHGQDWGCFTGGVPEWIYKLAVKLVHDDGLHWGMTCKDKEVGFDYAYRNAVHKSCGLIRDVEYMKTSKPRFTKKHLIEDYKKYFEKGNK